MWFCRKEKKKKKNVLISRAAANESICLTSFGYGGMVESVMAWGVFFKKLMASVLNCLIGMEEPPAKFKNSCCLLTTACGKSKRGSIYRAVKNRMPKSRYKELNMARPYFGQRLESNQATIAGIMMMIIKFRKVSINKRPVSRQTILLNPNFFCLVPK